MSDKSERTLNIYSGALAQIILISTAGIGAAGTLSQLAKSPDAIGWFKWAIVAMIPAIPFSFLAITGLIGEATQDKPDINRGFIRGNALLSIFAFVIGLILTVVGVFNLDSTEIQKPGQTNSVPVSCDSVLQTSNRVENPHSYLGCLPLERATKLMELDKSRMREPFVGPPYP
jgi:hypothetical protein